MLEDIHYTVLYGRNTDMHVALHQEGQCFLTSRNFIHCLLS